MIAYKQYNIELTKSQKKLIETYLGDIKKYIQNHSVDGELYSDIEERLFEKLRSEKEVSEVTIQKAIHEIGKPEEIFGESIDVDQDDSHNTTKLGVFYEKLRRNGWSRSNENAFVLGLSEVIGRKLGISTNIVRVIFFILLFVGSVGFWTYFIAGILIPLRGHNYNNSGIIGYGFKQLGIIIRDAITNIFYRVLPLMRIIFYVGVISIIMLALLGLIILAGAYTSNFTLYNIEFLAGVGPYMIWGVVSEIIFLGALLVFTILSAVKKKGFTKYFLAIGGLSFLGATLFFTLTGFYLLDSYSQSDSFNQNVSANLSDTSSDIQLDLYQISNNVVENNFLSDIYRARIVSSTGSELQVEIKNIVYGDTSIVESIKNGVSDYNLMRNENKYTLQYSNNGLYTSPVPLTDHQREVIISVPVGKKLRIVNGIHWIENEMQIINSQSKYGNADPELRTISVADMKLFFNTDGGKLRYELVPSAIRSIQEKIVFEKLIQDFDSYNPIKHTPEYKIKENFEMYLPSRSQKATVDWEINIIESEKGSFTIKYMDYDLIITAKVSYAENDEVLEITNFEITNINIPNGKDIDIKNYESIDEKYINLYEKNNY